MCLLLINDYVYQTALCIVLVKIAKIVFARLNDQEKRRTYTSDCYNSMEIQFIQFTNK